MESSEILTIVPAVMALVDIHLEVPSFLQNFTGEELRTALSVKLTIVFASISFKRIKANLSFTV